MDIYKFDCGCKISQISDEIKECDGLPPLKIDYYNLPECKEVWPLLGSGKTKGVFQLEKSLGKHWCKELYPENLNHLAALASILRPGILESILKDKNLTQHYCDNKNKKQEPVLMHPALSQILEDTYQVLIFQEQILLIAKEMAGFTGVEADTLRRGIGHKDAKIVFEMEKKFIDGCIRIGTINEEDAKAIFQIIKNSSRYSFNACLSPETIVETKNGYKTIEELKIGEYIKAPNEDKEEFVEVTNKIEQGTQDVYEITLESGKTIECTLDHKFLCENKEILPLWQIIQENRKIICETNIKFEKTHIKN